MRVMCDNHFIPINVFMKHVWIAYSREGFHNFVGVVTFTLFIKSILIDSKNDYIGTALHHKTHLQTFVIKAEGP